MIQTAHSTLSVPRQDPSWGQSLQAVLGIWLASRALILLVLLGIAPLLPTPPGAQVVSLSWDVFSAWDSLRYQAVATLGYDFCLAAGVWLFLASIVGCGLGNPWPT